MIWYLGFAAIQNRKELFKMKSNLIVNPGKKEIVESGGKKFICRAIRTPVVTTHDNLEDIIRNFVSPAAEPGDVVFLSEKMVACTEGRAYPVDEIKAGAAARFLSRFVTRTPYGIGLAMPQTMQCAIYEAGLPKILAAAAVGAVGKFFHQKGWFYRIAGEKVAAIDGPCSYTLPPYNKYVVLAPADSEGTARQVSKWLGGKPVLIVDANDLGCNILGKSDQGLDSELYLNLLRQNPLGQSTQCTPAGIFRPAAQ